LAGFGFAVTENCVKNGAGRTSPSLLLKLHLRQDKTRYVFVGKEKEHDAKVSDRSKPVSVHRQPRACCRILRGAQKEACKVVHKKPDGKYMVMVGTSSYATMDDAKAAKKAAQAAGDCK
jgi:hypothetical protein